MLIRRMSLLATIWLITLTVFAQSDLTGKWNGTEQSAAAVPVVLQLSVNNSNVTGSVIVGESPAQAISDGKIDGKKLMFKTTTMLNGKEAPISWEGEVQTNQLTLQRTFGPRKLPLVVLKRVK